MTNLQALKLKLKQNQKTDDELSLVLIENGFDPLAEYIPSDKFNVMIGYELFDNFAIFQSRISEGGYTIEWDANGMRDYIRYWWALHDMGDPFSGFGSIKNATDSW